MSLGGSHHTGPFLGHLLCPITFITAWECSCLLNLCKMPLWLVQSLQEMQKKYIEIKQSKSLCNGLKHYKKYIAPHLSISSFAFLCIQVTKLEISFLVLQLFIDLIYFIFSPYDQFFIHKAGVCICSFHALQHVMVSAYTIFNSRTQ